MNPFNTAAAALALIAIGYDTCLARHNRKIHKRDQETNFFLVDQLASALKRENYLSTLLDENEVSVSEFDRIAMKNL
jgi:hypothetical protein